MILSRSMLLCFRVMPDTSRSSSASQARFKDEARMDKATFLLLLQRLTSPIGQLRTSRVISPVTDALLRLREEIFLQPNAQTSPSARIRVFRNRKGFISQNVLGVVGWDLTFTFVLTGWEGSAHDGRVFNDAVLKGLSLPTGKFYLGDAGYALLPCLLTPHRGVRYRLKEWRAADQSYGAQFTPLLITAEYRGAGVGHCEETISCPREDGELLVRVPM
eukprot:gene667-723_t